MQVLISSKGLQMTDTLSKHIQNRIEFTLSRFGSLVRNVVVSVSDDNGPKGGVDKSCVIRIKTDNSSELIVKDTKSDVYAAVGKAIARSKHALSKHVKRTRVFKRKRLDMPQGAANDVSLAEQDFVDHDHEYTERHF